MKTIWIDLDNLPHVLIFEHLIKEFKNQGYNVLLTARDHAFTCELLQEKGINYIKVGKYAGKSIISKIKGTLGRAFLLYIKVRKYKPHIALSHGSRSQVIAAKIMKIPSIAMFDYEHVNSNLFEKLCFKIFVPEIVKQHSKFINIDNSKGYPGFKEELYLPFFYPDDKFLKSLNINDTKIIVVLRAPASTAHYHNPMADFIFKRVIKLIESRNDVIAIMLPRLNRINNAENYKNIHILEKPVDGLNLIYNADIIISGGGTMNREAALMNIPVYSIFMGKSGIMDKQLEEQNKLVFINDVAKIDRIKWEKKQILKTNNSDKTTFKYIISEIKTILDQS